jgi:hypothetical protein
MSSITSNKHFYGERITEHIRQQLISDKRDGGYGIQDNNLEDFLTKLIQTFGLDYSQFSPFINGNYAVFMEHGTWFKTLQEYSKLSSTPSQVHDYISIMDTTKSKGINISDTNIYGNKFENKLKFSQTITDIQLPEPNKEYMAISTRQKNSFVNTRDYVGSDFSINFLDDVNLSIFKYMEAWHKSIDLIREGLFFNGKTQSAIDYFNRLIEEDYLIDNPYCNTIWVALLDSKGVDLRGIITLFGVMPMNMPFKNLIGDRGSPKATSYNLNFKFMDMQYTFVDGWDSLNSAKGSDTSLTSKFFNYLGYGNNDNNATTGAKT